MDAAANPPSFRLFRIGDPQLEISLEDAIEESLMLVAERNPDFYQLSQGRLIDAD